MKKFQINNLIKNKMKIFEINFLYLIKRNLNYKINLNNKILQDINEVNNIARNEIIKNEVKNEVKSEVKNVKRNKENLNYNKKFLNIQFNSQINRLIKKISKLHENINLDEKNEKEEKEEKKIEEKDNNKRNEGNNQIKLQLLQERHSKLLMFQNELNNEKNLSETTLQLITEFGIPLIPITQDKPSSSSSSTLNSSSTSSTITT